MKSVIGTIVIFFGLYILISSGILSFIAQTGFLIFAITLVIIMLVIALVTLGIPSKRKRGHHDKKDSLPN